MQDDLNSLLRRIYSLRDFTQKNLERAQQQMVENNRTVEGLRRGDRILDSYVRSIVDRIAKIKDPDGLAAATVRDGNPEDFFVENSDDNDTMVTNNLKTLTLKKN